MSTLPYGSLFSNWSVKIIDGLDRCSRDAQEVPPFFRVVR